MVLNKANVLGKIAKLEATAYGLIGDDCGDTSEVVRGINSALKAHDFGTHKDAVVALLKPLVSEIETEEEAEKIGKCVRVQPGMVVVPTVEINSDNKSGYKKGRPFLYHTNGHGVRPMATKRIFGKGFCFSDVRPATESEVGEFFTALRNAVSTKPISFFANL